MYSARRPYPSDLSDAEWALLEPLLASPERRGRPPKWPARRVADAVFYLLRSGCAWRMLPREYPTTGRRSTTTSGNGAETGGSGGPTTGCARGARGGRTRPRSQRGRHRQPSGQGDWCRRSRAGLRRGEAALGQEAPSARGHRRGSCSAAASTPQACTIETAREVS